MIEYFVFGVFVGIALVGIMTTLFLLLGIKEPSKPKEEEPNNECGNVREFDVIASQENHEKRLRDIFDEQYAHGLVLNALISSLGEKEILEYMAHIKKEIRAGLQYDEFINDFVSKHPILRRGTQKGFVL